MKKSPPPRVSRFAWERIQALFTRQERTALIFLVAVGLLGYGALGWQRIFPPTPEPRFSPLVVRVNSADAQELAALPGIGPVLARRIVEYRRRHGRFVILEDLRRVKGVTPKLLNRIRGLVTFE